MPDDPTIPDEAIVWRYVPSVQIVDGDDGEGLRPSTGAFNDSSDGDPMSAILATEGREPATAIPQSCAGAGVVAFTAAFLRSLGLDLERAPEPDEPNHIVVRGAKTKSLKKKLKQGARWVVQGNRSTE